ncbi:alginate O-acetyltransferase AlgX-related protein [Phragmitibacter flavus]|nr:hypothetical protein [Phragmitibacter flavus]
MHNPYAEERDHTVFEIGHGVAWVVAVVFMLLLSVPPLVEHVDKGLKEKWAESPVGRLLGWKPKETTLLAHIRAVEGGLDAAGYSTWMRQTTQGWLTREFALGNRKSFIGYEGWLFYPPDLRALTGHGPLKKEPVSVMKAPELAKLPETRDVIVAFAKQLEERGVKLVLVPVPLKPMIYPEHVSPLITNEWITHPDAPAFYELLRREGVEVLDLTPDLAKVRSKRQHVFVRDPDRRDREAVAQAQEDARKLQKAFLMQDTHWSPEAMRVAAEKVAGYLRENHGDLLEPVEEMIRAEDGVMRSSLGDLVHLLDPKDADRMFAKEEAFLRVIGEGARSRESGLVLLGDSFVNIYDDASLGFDDPAVDNLQEPRMRAGFAEQLAVVLQQPLDVIAMNGRGSTEVRKEFARRPDDEVRSKKVVVWVIAARDVLLSRSAAKQADIEWGFVEFNPNKSKAGAEVAVASNGEMRVVVEAMLSEKSPNQSPVGTPYREALHAAVYDVEKVVEGKLEAQQVIGIQWTFRDKVMQPTSDFAEGGRYRLTLVPWDSKPELQGLNLEDTTSVFDAERWFVEKAEVME